MKKYYKNKKYISSPRTIKRKNHLFGISRKIKGKKCLSKKIALVKNKKTMRKHSNAGARSLSNTYAAEKIQSIIRGNTTRKHLRMLDSYHNILGYDLQNKIGFEYRKLLEKDRAKYTAALLIKYPFNITYANLNDAFKGREKAEALKNISRAKKITIYEAGDNHVSLIIDIYDKDEDATRDNDDFTGDIEYQLADIRPENANYGSYKNVLKFLGEIMHTYKHLVELVYVTDDVSELEEPVWRWWLKSPPPNLKKLKIPVYFDMPLKFIEGVEELIVRYDDKYARKMWDETHGSL